MNVRRSCYNVAVNANRSFDSLWVYGGRTWRRWPG